MTTIERNLTDATRISEIFSQLSEEGKIMVVTYLSALRDKEIADSKCNQEKVNDK